MVAPDDLTGAQTQSGVGEQAGPDSPDRGQDANELVRIIPVVDDINEPDAEDGAGRPQQRTQSVYDNGMGDHLRHDAERLRVLLERHHLHTGSARARALLDDWQTTLGKFVKVMPRDYAKALKQIEAERLAAASVAAE